MALRPDPHAWHLLSWVVVTNRRPKLLDVALKSILETQMPDRWSREIIVIHDEDDLAATDIVSARNQGGELLRGTASKHEGAARKRNLGLGWCRGELLCVADDDDIQSPYRARQAITAYMAGHIISSVRTFRTLHLSTGDLVRWTAYREDGANGTITGRARNYATDSVRAVGGWNTEFARGIDSDLTTRLRKKYEIDEFDLGRDQAESFVCIQHAKNVWPRPVVSKDRSIRHGGYMLHGEGHYSLAANVPPLVQEVMSP